MRSLREELDAMKIEAFNSIWSARNLDLSVTGHETIEDLSWWTIAHTAEKIEKKIKEWEKMKEMKGE